MSKTPKPKDSPPTTSTAAVDYVREIVKALSKDIAVSANREDLKLDDLKLKRSTSLLMVE